MRYLYKIYLIFVFASCFIFNSSCVNHLDNISSDDYKEEIIRRKRYNKLYYSMISCSCIGLYQRTWPFILKLIYGNVKNNHFSNIISVLEGGLYSELFSTGVHGALINMHAPIHKNLTKFNQKLVSFPLNQLIRIRAEE